MDIVSPYLPSLFHNKQKKEGPSCTSAGAVRASSKGYMKPPFLSGYTHQFAIIWGLLLLSTEQSMQAALKGEGVWRKVSRLQ